MRWILAGAVLCIGLYLAGLRKVLLICIALGAGVGGWIAFRSAHPVVTVAAPQAVPAGASVADQVLQATHRASVASTAAVPVSQIRVEDLHFDYNAAGGVSSVTARLHNLSENYTIGAVDYRLTVQHCKDSGAKPDSATTDCVAEPDQTGPLSVTVPPLQTRDIAIEIRRDWTGGSVATP
ncbi:MAG TPA: hypothetical protein VF315_08605, partial [Steroidobacteraceae bacterium]